MDTKVETNKKSVLTSNVLTKYNTLQAQGPLGQHWAKSGMPGQALAILGYFLAKNG